MKRVAAGLLVAAFAATAAEAQPSYTTAGGNVCIKINWIDRTSAPDDRTIVFYMKDNTAWITHLAGLCPQLRFNGFAYVATPPEDLCGNLQMIRVVRTGAVCKIGPLAPYTPAGTSRQGG
ncbi:MAG TPA: DUF6491 family protein [Rhizomicrobium sp.]